MTRQIDRAQLQQWWAELAVEELIRCGVSYFCVAPGSRSTPLTLAVASHPQASSRVHFDERGLGFHALGYAAARKGGVAIITTSGTAVANLLPAVVEASKKKVPLIVLTADRPSELRQTGANQTIAQPGIFGEYVRWACDFPVAEDGIDPAFVLTTMDQAVFRSRGELPGPVHINWMFREPFSVLSGEAPRTGASSTRFGDWQKSTKPFTVYHRGTYPVTAEALRSVMDPVGKAKRGVIVAGKLPGPKAAAQVARLAETLKWPLLPDLSSGLRLGTGAATEQGYFQHGLPLLSEGPDVVLHLGGRMTAKSYYEWIERYPPRDYIMVLGHPLRSDPGHRVSVRIQACPGELARRLTGWAAQQHNGSRLLAPLKRINQAAEKIITARLDAQHQVSEPAVARSVSRLIPRNQALFVSNSLPVRELNAFAVTDGPSVPVGANRGASGIDGIVASAAGFAAALQKKVTLLIGDLALLHDINSLALLREADQPVTLVVLNNDGGGIFEFLPVAQNSRSFESYFAAGQGLSFAAAARQFGLKYAQPATPAEFEKVYRTAVRGRQTTVIEVRTDRKANRCLHQSIAHEIKKKCRS